MKDILDKIFSSSRADKNLFSALFYGPKGVGKRTAFFRIVENCSPPEMKAKIASGLSPDILEFRGGESVSTFREKLEEYNTPAKELSHKWVLINNLDFVSRETQSYLLKTIEERNTYHIFLLATYPDLVSPALQSRIHPYKFSSLSKEDLSHILSADKGKTIYQKYAGKYPFRSFFELRVYTQYDFETLFANLFGKEKGQPVSSFLSVLDTFLKKVKEEQDFDRIPLLQFFLDFVSTKISESSEFSHPVFVAQFSKIQEKYSQSLFRDPPLVSSYEISLDSQIKAYLLCVYILRRMLP